MLTLRIAVPEDFDEVLADYTRHGYRVIAVAAKSIPGLTWIKAQRLKRYEASPRHCAAVGEAYVPPRSAGNKSNLISAS